MQARVENDAGSVVRNWNKRAWDALCVSLVGTSPFIKSTSVHFREKRRRVGVGDEARPAAFSVGRASCTLPRRCFEGTPHLFLRAALFFGSAYAEDRASRGLLLSHTVASAIILPLFNLSCCFIRFL
ncbi:hypothetical protein MRX96_016595 [Rhipicephalus microplus]